MVDQADRDAVLVQVRIDLVGLRLAHRDQHAHAAQRGFVVGTAGQVFFEFAPHRHERSGLQREPGLQALAEGRDPGDLTTIEDATALEQIRAALEPQGVTKV